MTATTTAAPVYVRALRRLLGREQPDGLFLLFTVEMWERFSYYGMRAFLVLFLVSTAGGFGWSKAEASHLYAWYTGFVYLTPLIGGYLADRWLGTHRAMVIGGAVIAAGHFCLALPGRPTFFVGLALIVIGTGFFKSNVSTMVGQLYTEDDRRRDAGFTIFYMGINSGAFLGPLLCGGLADRLGWHWGFGAAGVGMVMGLVGYVFNKQRVLGTVGDKVLRGPAATEPADRAAENAHHDVEAVLAIVLLSFFNIFFWMAFEQAGSSMSFFANERTDRHVFGWAFPAPFFQSINPVCIILLAPVFARFWIVLARRGREPSTPVKFACGLMLVAVGFGVMVVAARLSDGGAKVGPGWLAAAYVIHTCGELCLSPVGLSMVTKLAPRRIASLMMGLWFVGFFVSDVLAGLLAGAVEAFEKGTYFHWLGGQADFFMLFVLVPGAAGLLLFALSPTVKKLMHGRA